MILFWDNISAYIKKEFDSKPLYNFFLITKIKFHGDEVTDFLIKNF